MAKKKAGRRGKAGDLDSAAGFDDAASNASSGTAWSVGEWGAPGGLHAAVEDDNPLELAIDALYEKRATTREKALADLAMLLSTSYLPEDVEQRQETLGQLALSSVRRGGAAEAAAAMRLLGFVIVTLGAGDSGKRLFRESQPVLVTAAKAGKAVGVRAAAAETLALAAFVAAEDLHATEAVMQDLAPLRTAASSKAGAAAVRGWALLLSTLPAWRLTSAFVEDHLGRLTDLLHSDDVEVRGAAGEAVALLYNTAGMSELDSEGYSSPASQDTEVDAEVSGLEDVVSRMQDLALNRGDAQRRSRRERASLRSTFRGLLASVQDGAAAEAKVKLRHGDVVMVDGLAGVVQLNALRRFLAEGFQEHMQANPLLHQVFNYQPRREAAEKLTAYEKRLYRSPASNAAKSRTRQRNSERYVSSQYKAAMLGGGECW